MINYGKVRGQNHVTHMCKNGVVVKEQDEISYLELTQKNNSKKGAKGQIKKCWAPSEPKVYQAKVTQGIDLVAKHIADGNAVEAQLLLNRIIYREQVKPALASIELNFVAEDIWNY